MRDTDSILPWPLSPSQPPFLPYSAIKNGGDARRGRSPNPAASPMLPRLFGASWRSIAPLSQPFGSAQFGLDLASFGGIVAPRKFGAQFLDLLFDRHDFSPHLAKDEASPGGGRAGSRTAKRPRERAMGVPILSAAERSEAQRRRRQNWGHHRSLTQPVRRRMLDKTERIFPLSDDL